MPAKPESGEDRRESSEPVLQITSGRRPSSLQSVLRRGLWLVLWVFLGYFGVSFGVFWLAWAGLDRALSGGQWPFVPGTFTVEHHRANGKGAADTIVFASGADGASFQARLGRETLIGTFTGAQTLWGVGAAAAFVGEGARSGKFLEDAVGEQWGKLVRRHQGGIFLAAVMAFPRITGLGWDRGLVVHQRIRGGTVAWKGFRLAAADLRVPGSGETSTKITFQPGPVSLPEPAIPVVNVPADELDRSLATVVELALLRFHPVPVPPDGFVREGNGWLRVRDGQRLVHLAGTPEAMGHQHGTLLAAEIATLVRRAAFGIGLAYSLKQGRWFPAAARAIYESQLAFTDPAYDRELSAMAGAAGVPVDWVRIANVFPEFFHCSGAALSGGATRDGRLLHARVLDYFTDFGLQDAATVFAFAPEGRNEWVSVGYAGFLGTVTAMNQHQLSLGEMGGRRDSEWDGVPMALLLRGLMEHCATLEEGTAWLADHPRTCEYFYLLGDGRTCRALGFRATPEALEVVRMGENHPLLPDALPDTILLSGGRRYETLRQRVHEHHGHIDPATLREIIRRPVAMKSNLHNVLFDPAHRTFQVANASRSRPACSESYHAYTWEECFPLLPPAAPTPPDRQSGLRANDLP